MGDLACDVAVIGAGTAGLAAEHHARKAGASTLLIDPHYAGTTCARVGCMPSKLLIAAGDAAWSVRHAAEFGIAASPRIDGCAVMARLRRERDRFVSGVQKSIARIPDEARIAASAAFCGPDRLRLSDGRTIKARAIVIATGAAPAVPKVFAAVKDRVLTNESLFELADLPASVGVIGAGPLGLELGQALARLGVRVELFDLGDRVAGLQERKVSDTLRALLEEEFPIHLGTGAEAAPCAEGVRLNWDGQSRDFERLLVAAGRPPNLEGLDLDAAGIERDEKGLPVFDPETLRCGSSNTFIAGDANGHRPLLHEAAHEGVIAGRNAAALPDITAFSPYVPVALTFTRPEAAVVGHIPDRDEDHASAEARYDDQGRARVEARLGGLVRLHARRRDGRLVGASLCAPGGGHLAHLLAWAISAELTVADLLDMPFYHPTLEEGLKPALRALCAKIGAAADETRREDSPCA